MKIFLMGAALGVMATIGSVAPAAAEPVLDTFHQVDENDGYGPWIIIRGEKPVEVGQFESIYWRNFDGLESRVPYLTYGLQWGNKQAIRLKSGHPLYKVLAAGSPAPVPSGAEVPDIAKELREIRAAVDAIERKLGG